MLNRDGLLNWWRLTRGAPLLSRTDLNPTPSDRVRASSMSGAISGATLGLLFRGPKNVIPGTIMFTFFGFGGQHAYNFLDRRNSEEVKRREVLREEGNTDETWLQRVAKSKSSPVKVLSDEEYEKIMQEKLLGVEASIALIDERIEELRKKQIEKEKQRGVTNEPLSK